MLSLLRCSSPDFTSNLECMLPYLSLSVSMWVMAGEGCRICMGSASGSDTTLWRWCSVPKGQPAPEGVLAQHVFPFHLKSLAYRLFLLGKGVRWSQRQIPAPKWKMGFLVSPILPTASCPDLFGLNILFQIKFSPPTKAWARLIFVSWN